MAEEERMFWRYSEISEWQKWFDNWLKRMQKKILKNNNTVFDYLFFLGL